ncbi:unnamed protein product [Discosporangium mesarthrocarpum]
MVRVVSYLLILLYATPGSAFAPSLNNLAGHRPRAAISPRESALKPSPYVQGGSHAPCKHLAAMLRGGQTEKEVRAQKIEEIWNNCRNLFYDRGVKKLLGTKKKGETKANLLSGVTVTLAMVPEAIGFALLTGVSPLAGLWSTVLLGFSSAVFGGRPGMMSGASGAVGVVLAKLTQQHGLKYIFPTVILGGILQIIAGVLRLGKFIRLVPHPVMLGFVNGLAVVILKCQLAHFKVAGAWLTGAPLASMVGLTGLTMAIIQVLPLITTAVPASLAAVLLTSVVARGLNMPVRTLADLAGAETFAGGLAVLPKFALPAIPATLATLKIILPFAVVMASVGLIESLLTLTLIDSMTETRGVTHKECFGQGLGNVACGLFGGMGGCALIGQSIINVSSGGNRRLSGIVMSVLLGFGIVTAAPLIGQIPLASVVGLMIMCTMSMFEWSLLRILRSIPTVDAIVLILVSGITLWKDLAVAVLSGVVLSALSFAWKSSQRMVAVIEENAGPEKWKTYRLSGPLFFGSAASFSDLFDPKDDPENVVVDFMGSRVYDHSAIEAIDALAVRYRDVGKTVHLRHLSPDCKTLLSNAKDLVEVGQLDPIYGVADNYKDVPAPTAQYMEELLSMGQQPAPGGSNSD